MTAGAVPIRAEQSAAPRVHLAAGTAGLVLWSVFLAVEGRGLAAGWLGNPVVLTAVHLAALAWATTVAMGAAYQLLPVALGAPAPLSSLGYLSFACFYPGSWLLAGGFWSGLPQLLALGGALITVGVYVFAAVVLTGVVGVRRWTPSAAFLTAAVVYLAGAVTWGLTMALDLNFGFWPLQLSRDLGFHLLLALGGWFSLLIIGVSYTLLPMFFLSDRAAGRTAWSVFALLNVGLIGLAVAIWLGSPAARVAAVAVVWSGLVLWLWDLRAILARRRRRGRDVPLRHAVAGALAMALAVTWALGMLAGLFPAGGREVLAAGYLFLVGGVSSTIMGHLYRVAPFLIWVSRYAPRVGRGPVPLVRQLLREGWQEPAFWAFGLGVLGTLAGLVGAAADLLAAGLILQAAGAVLFGGNILAAFAPRRG